MPAVKVTPEGHKRLAERMDERRKELRLRWQQVAIAAGISVETLGAVRRVSDNGIADATLWAIDDGLRWVPGSAEQVATLQGEPEPLPLLRETAGGGEVDASVADSWDRIRDWVEMMNGFSPAERDAELQRINANLRRIRGEDEPQSNGSRRAG